MQRSEILQQLQSYIAEQVLEGKDIGLDEQTPLLEWGILNSFETVRLFNFIQEQFDVFLPPDKLVADYFTNLSTITTLVMETMEETLIER